MERGRPDVMTRRIALLGGRPVYRDPLYVSRPLVPTMAELAPLFEQALQAKWLTNNGQFAQRLEAELKAFLQTPHCPIFCNGTLALQLAVRGLRLAGEVITTPFTFPATTHVLHWNHVTPVFCDVGPETYNMDPGHLESLISPQTTGVLPVHVFGNPCDVDRIADIAAYYGLRVVYDAAHAFGVEYKGASIASFGDAVMFSFHATKTFNTLEGGAVACSDANLAQRLHDLRNFGIRDEGSVVVPGINAKMNEFQAAFGLVLLGKVRDSIAARRRLFERYHVALASVPGLRFQNIRARTNYNYQYMSLEIVADEYGLDRDHVWSCLRAENIVARKYFWPLCSNLPCYQRLPSASLALLPNANRLAKRILNLPLHNEMTEDDVDRVVEIVAELPRHAGEIRHALAGTQETAPL
jgi:dTDP-4-amino-4,6-dideoxygalactose transaminase